jgi:hypothetical protein
MSEIIRQKKAMSRIPSGSVFFEKVVPMLLVLMGVLTVALVLFAAGVLIGIFHF